MVTFIRLDTCVLQFSLILDHTMRELEPPSSDDEDGDHDGGDEVILYAPIRILFVPITVMMGATRSARPLQNARGACLKIRCFYKWVSLAPRRHFGPCPNTNLVVPRYQ